MNLILQLSQIFLPVIAVLAVTYYLVKRFLDHQTEQQEMNMKMKLHESVTPIRLQAYERLMLLLERMQPAGMLMRHNRSGMNAIELQTALLQGIRDEFEHNLSQQLYVSIQAWEKVRNAREEMISLINTAAAKVKPDAPSADLAQNVLALSLEVEILPVQQAIDFLKIEVRQNFF
ncbi:MAG TPA: hypothetical protein PLJ84_07880 [Bacteroidales bacterium]|nr:hypothetical protein [Bacteroidales bacterium]